MKNTNKSRDINFYLTKIQNLEYLEFGSLQVFSTKGDVLASHPWQWRAYTRHREGEDDAYEGVGWTPLQAVKDLYNNIQENQVENIEY